MTSEPVLASDIRNSAVKLNGDGKPHTERHTSVTITYREIEDRAAFHALAEEVRLAMLDRLRDHGAPINVWRTGHLVGYPASDRDPWTDNEVPWTDEHRITFRTRVSVEVNRGER